MRIVKVSAIRRHNLKSQLKKLIKRHGSVVLFSTDGDNSYRKRHIDKDGLATVSYKSRGYRRWSKYSECCFMSYTENQSSWDYDRWDNYSSRTIRGKKQTIDRTIDALIEHDNDNDISFLEIKYGKGLKRSLLVLGKY